MPRAAAGSPRVSQSLKIAHRFPVPCQNSGYVKHHLTLAGRSDTLFSDDATTTASAKPGAPSPPATIKLTPLDPQRPALDLLEDILAGIRGCHLLYSAHEDLTDEINLTFDQAVRERAKADQGRLM